MLPDYLESFLDQVAEHLRDTGHAFDADELVSDKRAGLISWYESGLDIESWDEEMRIIRSPEPFAMRLARLGKQADKYLAQNRAVRLGRQ